MDDPLARRHHCRRALSAGLLAAVLLGGCGLPSQRAETDSSAGGPVNRTPAPASSPPEVGRESVETTSRSPVTAGRRTLAIEQRHPNGSVLRVTSLTVEPNAIRLGIQVVNGASRDFGLAPGGAVVGLTDDRGGRYEFIDPTANPDLQIQQRGTLTGELVYFGVLDPAASSLRLQTNAVTIGSESSKIYDPATETANEPFPHFSVEIPLDR